jgi:glycosyltransferase involved in cell wall biosynthesis
VERARLPISEFPLTSLYNFNAARLFLRLVRFLRRERIDILHAFDFYTSVFAVPAGRIAGVPVVLASRRELLDLRSPLQQRAIRLACWFATGVVANSRAAGQDIFGPRVEGSRRVDILPNCINLDDFKPDTSCGDIRDSLGIARDAFVIGALGNLRPEKDFSTFLRAARVIHESVASAVFLIVGEGPERTNLERLVGQLNLSGTVHFLGERPDVANVLSDVDVLVMSSITESFPNAILEGMAIGKPIVATNVGGVPDLVEEGCTGFLVPPHDPTSIAERILRLWSNSTLRASMGEEGRNRVARKFTVGRVVEQLEAIYARELRKRGGNGYT